MVTASVTKQKFWVKTVGDKILKSKHIQRAEKQKKTHQDKTVPFKIQSK